MDPQEARRARGKNSYLIHTLVRKLTHTHTHTHAGRCGQGQSHVRRQMHVCLYTQSKTYTDRQTELNVFLSSFFPRTHTHIHTHARTHIEAIDSTTIPTIFIYFSFFAKKIIYCFWLLGCEFKITFTIFTNISIYEVEG